MDRKTFFDGQEMTATLNRIFSSQIITTITKISWALFLIFLPVTSFPYFPHAFGGGALVRPLSIYPLLVLLLIATIPRVLTRSIPKTLLTIVPFVLLAIASSLISTLRGIHPWLGVSVVSRIIRALLTLGLGCAIYYTVSLIPCDKEALRASLRWLYLGFSLALIWGTLQTVYVVKFSPGYFQTIADLQEFVSIRHLFTNRVSGMTYEPNWFAEQISFLFVPWLLASVIFGYSVFKWRWRWLTIELFLLFWAVTILVFTFSRAGLITILALAFFGFIFYGLQRWRQRDKEKGGSGFWVKGLIGAVLIMLLVLVLIYFAGTKNEFFSRIWVYWLEKNDPTLDGYLQRIGFGARMVYSETAYRIYQAFPVFGVGLGNYAFYFNDMLPMRPLAETPEVLRLVTPDIGSNRLITPKNFYLRLLSETGLIGTAAFFAFLIALFGCALFLWLSSDGEQNVWGTAGLLGLIAFTMSAFSFDSFAIPNMWVVFGLITASAAVFNKPSQIVSD